MIEFKPITSNPELEKHFKDIKGDFGYIAVENGAKIGECIAKLDGYNMSVLKVVADDGDEYAIEGLIRSALNFGANRGAYVAQICDNCVENVAVKLGFICNDGILSAEIPDILKGSCGGCKN